MSGGGISVVGLMFLTLIVLSFFGGIVLMLLSRRNVARHPACGQCGYDVTGTIGEGERCPECGAAFAEVGIRAPQGRGEGRRLMFGAGLVLVVLSLGCVGSSLFMFGYRSTRATAVAPPPPVQTVAPANAPEPEPE